MCRHWAAATSGVQAMGFSSVGIGVFLVVAMGVFECRHLGFFVVTALVFLCLLCDYNHDRKRAVANAARDV